MGRKEHCKQISLACVGSACSVWATLGLPPLTACVLFQSTLLRLQVALQENSLKWALGCMHFLGLSCSGSGSQVHHKGIDPFGHAFCALPRSKQLRQPGVRQVHCPRWAVRLNHLPISSRSLSFPGAPQEHHLRCAIYLLWGADFGLRPSWCMSIIQDLRKTWLAAGSLLPVW